MKNISSLSIINLILLSAFSGGCLMVLFVLLPFWQSSTPEVFLNWFAAHNKAIGMTMLPMEVLPLIASVVLFFVALRQKKSNIPLWLLTNICNLIILVMFIVYFFSANRMMASGRFPADKVSEELQKWKTIHIARTITSVLAIVFCGLAIKKADE